LRWPAVGELPDSVAQVRAAPAHDLPAERAFVAGLFGLAA
jgi:hypothetical protein